MEIVNDYFMVTVDQEFQMVKLKSGLMSLNAAYFEKDQESKYRFKTQHGVVVGVPQYFSDSVIDVVDTGIPQRRKFIPSEFIQKLANQGYTKLPEYWPSAFDEFETITFASIGEKTNVNIGDTIYFDYAITDEENYLGEYKGKKMYKVRVDLVYCVARRVRSKVDFRYRTEIIPQGGWAIVEPDMETWDEIKTEHGLVRKPKPTAKLLLGFVKYISKREDIKTGDHIVYIRNADYMVLIEGRYFFVMKESDILCKVNYELTTLKIQP